MTRWMLATPPTPPATLRRAREIERGLAGVFEPLPGRWGARRLPVAPSPRVR